MAPPFEFLKVPKAMIVTVTAKLVTALAVIPFRTAPGRLPVAMVGRAPRNGGGEAPGPTN